MKNIFDLVIRFMAISAMLVGVSLAMVATAPEAEAQEVLAIKPSEFERAQTIDASIRQIDDIDELNRRIYDLVFSSANAVSVQMSGRGGEESGVWMARNLTNRNSRDNGNFIQDPHLRDYWKELALWRDVLRAFITVGGGGDIDAIKRFAVVGVNVNAINEAGSTALHYAVYDMIGYEPVAIQYLTDIGANPTIRNKDGITPLMLLVQGKTRSGVIHFPVAEVLVEAGANPNVQNFAGETLLHFATQQNKPERVKKFLLAGANSNIGNKVSGETPLMHAAKKGFVDVAKLLFGGGADIHIKDKGGRTALDYAKRIGNAELVSLLQKAELASDDELLALRKKALAKAKKPKEKRPAYLPGILGHEE